MTEKELVHSSKFLSLVLRHKPGVIGLTLDKNGWADVSEVLAGMQKAGHAIDLEKLQYIVAHNNKKRFAFNEDCTRIRASQGHSVEVDLDYAPSVPPELLFHGTALHNLDSIKIQGLIKGKRHHVHLSSDYETALKVGLRHGKPVVLEIKAGAMHRHNIPFFLSANKVWLTEQVLPEYIVFKD